MFGVGTGLPAVTTDVAIAHVIREQKNDVGLFSGDRGLRHANDAQQDSEK